MKRSFGVDGLACTRCGGRLTVRAVVRGTCYSDKLLGVLGVGADFVELHPARDGLEGPDALGWACRQAHAVVRCVCRRRSGRSLTGEARRSDGRASPRTTAYGPVVGSGGGGRAVGRSDRPGERGLERLSLSVLEICTELYGVSCGEPQRKRFEAVWELGGTRFVHKINARGLGERGRGRQRLGPRLTNGPIVLVDGPC